jgi:hypothetical protein
MSKRCLSLEGPARHPSRFLPGRGRILGRNWDKSLKSLQGAAAISVKYTRIRKKQHSTVNNDQILLI